MRLTGDLHQKHFRNNTRKNFLNVSFFFRRFSLEKDGFFAVSSCGKSGFRVLSVYLKIFFGAQKLMKVSFGKVLGKLAGSLTLGFPYDIA